MNDNPLYALSTAVWDWCMKNCQPRVALDIGANLGAYTQRMVEAGFYVHAFEPVPDVYAKLAYRFKTHPKVACNNIGLSDYPLRLSNITVCSAWTLAEPQSEGVLSVCPDYKDKPRFDVELETVDRWLAGTRVGFIKLDVDGYEHKVLAGAAQTIMACRPPILCEFSQYIKLISGDLQAFIEFILNARYVVTSCDGKAVFKSWDSIAPHYPYQSSFDVMLLPAELSEMILRDL